MPERYVVWKVVKMLADDGFIICDKTLRRWESGGRVGQASRDYLGRRYWTPVSYLKLRDQVKNILTR